MSDPGYVDLQVNGYAGIDFNDPALTTDMVHEAAGRLRADGTTTVLATVITAPTDEMVARIRTIARARDEERSTRSTIAGIHVEGPFLSDRDGYVGAHPRDNVCDANLSEAERLIDAGGGAVRLFTLAPERDARGAVTRHLVDRGLVVAAGHTDATVENLRACIDSGLSLFTHLGNGCPMQMHRHDNIIWRALALRDHLRYGLIADGVHLPPTMLRAIIDLVGIDRCFVVTDAIAAAGLGPGTYTLGRQRVTVDTDRVVWSEDRTHFVGSASTMAQCAGVLCTAGFRDDETDALVRRNPAAIVA